MTLTLFKEIAMAVKPPRSMYVKFPFGSPMGRPNDQEKQLLVLNTLLETLEGVTTPGTIVEPDIKY